MATATFEEIGLATGGRGVFGAARKVEIIERYISDKAKEMQSFEHQLITKQTTMRNRCNMRV